MSTEQGPKPGSNLETLTEDQANLSRQLFVHRFKKLYLLFQEFEKSSILFQKDLVRNKNEHAIVFPNDGINYIVPYENLDMEFIDIFEKDLKNPDQKPINFRQIIVINKHTHDMPTSLRDYLGRRVETMETVYFLKPVDGKNRAVWQTTYLDQLTGTPIAEKWEGVIEGKIPPITRTSQ